MSDCKHTPYDRDVTDYGCGICLAAENESLRHDLARSMGAHTAALNELAEARGLLREWDALILHQFSGTREGISALTSAAQKTAEYLTTADQPTACVCGGSGIVPIGDGYSVNPCPKCERCDDTGWIESTDERGGQVMEPCGHGDWESLEIADGYSDEDLSRLDTTADKSDAIPERE
jgi:hypothetical protein